MFVRTSFRNNWFIISFLDSSEIDNAMMAHEIWALNFMECKHIFTKKNKSDLCSHCAAHTFNLAVSYACKLVPIKLFQTSNCSTTTLILVMKRNANWKDSAQPDAWNNTSRCRLIYVYNQQWLRLWDQSTPLGKISKLRMSTKSLYICIFRYMFSTLFILWHCLWAVTFNFKYMDLVEAVPSAENSKI